MIQQGEHTILDLEGIYKTEDTNGVLICQNSGFLKRAIMYVKCNAKFTQSVACSVCSSTSPQNKPHYVLPVCNLVAQKIINRQPVRVFAMQLAIC